MLDRLTWVVTDGLGNPLPSATPVVVMYDRNGVVRTAPTVNNLGGGLFSVEPSDDDTSVGVVVFIDNGLAAAPRYEIGVSSSTPLDAFLVTTAADDSLWLGATPTIGRYVDDSGVSIAQPDILRPTTYLAVLVPRDDTNANYRVDPASGALLDHAQGAFVFPASSGVNIFNVDADAVRRAHFPNWSPFSAKTNPTETTVATIINEEAADLAGALRLKQVDPTSITASSSEAFVWCAKTLKLAAAVRIYPAVTAANPEVTKALQAQLDNRYAWLEKHGLELDGADASLTSTPEGPTSHISTFGLRTDSASNMSSTEAPFHKDDHL